MKPKLSIYSQSTYLIPRTAIEMEQKQFIKIAFAVHLSAVISAERYRSDSVALKSEVLHFVFFMIIINKMKQSAAQRCLKNSLLEVFPLTVGSGKTMAFENRRGKYKELGKKVPQAYRVYVEDTFLPCDAVIARIFSKEMTHTDNQGDNEEQKVKRYYYHSDHLGSAQFVTDWKGRQYEHIEYTSYGELWIEEVAAGLDKLPFRFTGKELDEETGLYYYGARYLDPKYSRWLSGDPALGEYIPQAPVNDEAKKHNENLPGMGGVYNTVNLHVYHYAGNNPVKYTDPDGNFIASYFANTKFNNAFNFFIEKYQKKLDTINRASQLYQQIYDIPKNTALEDAIVFDKEQAYDYILTTAGINAEQMGYEKNSEEYNNYVKQETKLYSKLQELRKQKYTDGTYKNGLVDKILNTALNLYNNKYQECISEGLSDIEAMKHADSVANEYLNKTLEDNEL
nr:RHS repeat-associated core domain-containing protein [Treponema denticola]